MQNTSSRAQQEIADNPQYRIDAHQQQRAKHHRAIRAADKAIAEARNRVEKRVGVANRLKSR